MIVGVGTFLTLVKRQLRKRKDVKDSSCPWRYLFEVHCVE